MIGVRRPHNALLIALIASGLLSTSGFAKSKPITPQDLFTNLSPTEPWHKGRLTATKTVNFNQTASGGTDATTVSKVQLAFFTSANCTGDKEGSGFYNTPSGTSFTISVGTPFGLVAASTWDVGETQLTIADMTTINSVAITLKSTNNDVPQSNFSNSSFACIAVTCASNTCTSAAGTQSFELKTTAAVGDPADGGKIADLTAGLIVTAADNSSNIQWTNTNAVTGAQSDTDGSANTTTIVGNISCSDDPASCAANLCNTLSITGGYTSDWFLPAKDQLNTLFTNKIAIGGFLSLAYWSSTESVGSPADTVWLQLFSDGRQLDRNKVGTVRARCVRAFTP